MRWHLSESSNVPLESNLPFVYQSVSELVSPLLRGGATMADHMGQQLGNYRLIRLLGQGNFSEVYLGEHIHLNTRAAIKVLHGQLTSDYREGFLSEARTIAHLRHPHIIQVLDFGLEGMTPFLVMDYAPNGTLRQCHPTGTLLPLGTVVTYVTQVAQALQYAHQEKLIHRDIKPENMLLGRSHEVLLSDFGIATISQSSRQQQAQDTAGTIAYMAPLPNSIASICLLLLRLCMRRCRPSPLQLSTWCSRHWPRTQRNALPVCRSLPLLWKKPLKQIYLAGLSQCLPLISSENT